MAGNARRMAVEALVRLHLEGSYSNVVLETLLGSGGRGNELSAPDQALLSRLFYGVLERLLTLDYVIDKHSTVRLKKMHPVVLELLRLGCYQLVYMDKIPPSAAVNETVKLARAMKQDRAVGLINAVLRAIERNRAHLLDALPDDETGLSIRTSCPVDLIRLWITSYGYETARWIAESANQSPPVTIRVNTFKITQNDFDTKLFESGISVNRHPYLVGCYDIKDSVGLKKLAEIMENCYYHQDAASQICCKALGAEPDEKIADLCAAPGGKSLTSAQMMMNKGEILACDVHAFKCDEMEKRTKRCGATIIHTVARDASLPCPESLAGKFDRVLCDVPCSGLGVIRRKPEIRYKPLLGFSELPQLQYNILHQSSRMVRGGGVLQYSTCTLNPAENEQVTERFLKEHPEFSSRILPLEESFDALGQQPSHQITLFPPIHQTDGFYIAGFIKQPERGE